MVPLATMSLLLLLLAQTLALVMAKAEQGEDKVVDGASASGLYVLLPMAKLSPSCASRRRDPTTPASGTRLPRALGTSTTARRSGPTSPHGNRNPCRSITSGFYMQMKMETR